MALKLNVMASDVMGCAMAAVREKPKREQRPGQRQEMRGAVEVQETALYPFLKR